MDINRYFNTYVDQEKYLVNKMAKISESFFLFFNIFTILHNPPP